MVINRSCDVEDLLPNIIMVGESVCSCEMVEAGTLQGHQVPAVGGQAHQGLPRCYSLALLIITSLLSWCYLPGL